MAEPKVKLDLEVELSDKQDGDDFILVGKITKCVAFNKEDEDDSDDPDVTTGYRGEYDQGSGIFKASNGFSLYSSFHPEFTNQPYKESDDDYEDKSDGLNPGIFVNGEEKEKDKNTFEKRFKFKHECVAYKANIKKLVAEYKAACKSK